MKKSKKISFTSIIISISIILMFGAVAVPFASYTLAAISGVLLIIVVIEIDIKWALSGYLITTLLSIMLVPDKETVLFYASFLGYYPIIKSKIETKFKKTIEYIIKIIIFNLSILMSYILLMFVLKTIPISVELKSLSQTIIIFGILLLNVTFILYDIAMSQFIYRYIMKYQKTIHKIIK